MAYNPPGMIVNYNKCYVPPQIPQSGGGTFQFNMNKIGKSVTDSLSSLSSLFSGEPMPSKSKNIWIRWADDVQQRYIPLVLKNDLGKQERIRDELIQMHKAIAQQLRPQIQYLVADEISDLLTELLHSMKKIALAYQYKSSAQLSIANADLYDHGDRLATEIGSINPKILSVRLIRPVLRQYLDSIVMWIKLFTQGVQCLIKPKVELENNAERLDSLIRGAIGTINYDQIHSPRKIDRTIGGDGIFGF